MIRLWYDEIAWDEGYSRDEVLEWEPSQVTGLRAKVNHGRQWTRADGSLVEVPL